MKLFFKSLFILLLASIIICLLGMIYLGYKGILDSIIGILDTKKTSQYLANIISAERFLYIELLLICLIFFIALLLWKFNTVYNVTIKYLSDLFHFIKSLFKITVNSAYKYLLIIPIFASIYYALTMPVCYDEGLTYLYFTSKTVLASISYYPEPNNHILHSLLTNITYYIPLGGTLIHLRISSLIVNWITWMLAYKLLITYFNKQTGLAVAAIGSMLFLTFYYGYQSRGYALLNLFFIGILYNALGIIREKDNLNNWVWFGVSSVLGFYTMPSFLYPFLTINLLIVVFNWPNLKRQLITNLIVAITVVCLYLPIIIVNGLKALTNNPFVKPIARMDVIGGLPLFLQTTLNEITGFPWYIVLFLLLPSFIYIFIKRDKFKISLFLLFMLAPFVLLTVHSVIPFPRTFVYYGFILPFLAFFGYSEQLAKVPIRYLTIFLVCLQLGLLYKFNRNIIAYEERDPQLNWSSKKYTDMMVGNKRYFSSGNLLGTTLLYELKTQGYSKAEVIYYDGPVNADTLQSFDYIIIGLINDKTISKKPKISTAYYHIYY